MVLRIGSTCRNDVERCGTVLVAILIIAALSAMAAGSLMFRMRAEATASGAYGRGDQAWTAAFNGIAFAMTILADPPDDVGFHDNPELFADRFVCNSGGDQWYFTIYAPSEIEDTEVRYGVTDTAGLININTASRKTLEALPNMTAELVDCLIDFRDPNDEPEENGAEQEYYNQLAHPYGARNGMFVTVEELLMVKGFNGLIVYGEDANFNGLLDPNEDDGEDTHPNDDDSDGMLNRGLRGLVTTMSYGSNVTNDGGQRININGRINSSSLRQAVGRTTADFIEAYRSGNGRFTHPSQLLRMSYRPRRGRSRQSGVNDASQLARVLDALTTVGGRTMPPGAVNVNTAPPEVLLAVLGGDNADLVNRIVSTRTDLTAEEKTTTAWLYGNSLVDSTKFKTIAPLLTARGFQYHIQVVGYGVRSGRFCVLEAIVDLAGRSPRVIYLRNITRLGMPFALDSEKQEAGA